MAQWLRLHSSKAGDSGSLELRSHMAQGVAKKKKNKEKMKCPQRRDKGGASQFVLSIPEAWVMEGPGLVGSLDTER